MKTKNDNLIVPWLKNGLQLYLAMAGLFVCQTLLAAATFNITPSSVCNTYSGTITLQIGGVPAGDTVVVQKYLDLNADGVLDAGDWLVQQFNLTDGQGGMVIGGVTNINVPGDTDGAANGQITAVVNFRTGDFMQNFAGTYLVVLSSPANHFSPITKQLTVTKFPYPQSISGNVVNGSSSATVPDATVLLFPPPRAGDNGPGGSPLAGVVANSTGNYSIQAPPGTYMVVAFASNFVSSFASPAIVTLGTGASASTNLTLNPATSTISGTVEDAANAGLVLPGVLVPIQTDSGLLGIGTTDPNGNFNVGVLSGQWNVKADDTGLIVHGYLGWESSTNVPAGATGVVVGVPEATALFFGNVKDNLGNPMVGIDVYVDDSNQGFGLYETDGYTDQNGNYVTGVVGGSDLWEIDVSTGSNPTNYIYSQSLVDADTGETNLDAGEVMEEDFVAQPVVGQISGYLKDSNGNPIGGVGINGQVTINSYSYNNYVDTATNGYYAFNVCNGSNWMVWVNLYGSDGLPSQYLPNGGYQQTTNVSNASVTVNITVVTATNFISGYLTDNQGNPIANIGIYASSGDNKYNLGGNTGTNGYYSIGVANDEVYNVGVEGLPSNYLQFVNTQTVPVTNDSPSGIDFTAILATNFISGYVRDNHSNPISNIWVYAYEINSPNNYNTGATTDNNGHYSFGVPNDTAWDVGVNGDLPSNYLNPPDQQAGVTNDSVEVDFTAILANNFISGQVTDNSGNPMPNVWVYCYEIDSTNNYNTGANTDNNGHYSFGVINSNLWDVGVNGDLPSGYLSPNDQDIAVTNDSPTGVNFVALLATNFITGNVQTSIGTNIVGVGVMASATIDNESYTNYVDTDGNGDYSLNVGNGIWTVSLNSTNCCDDLDNILGLNNYVGPNNQTANIANHNATNNFVVASCGFPVIQTTSPPDGLVGVYYQGFGQVSGCYPPFTWYGISGMLPPGLVGNTNGEIYGIPTNAGTFFFTTGVMDSHGQTNSATISLTIVDPLTITTASLGGDTQSVYYSQQLQGSGGHPPYTWSWSSNTPPGLNLGTNGLLSGYPTSTGTFVFSVQASDSYAYLASTNQNTHLDVTNRTLSLTIVPMQFTINASAGANGSLFPNGSSLMVNEGANQGFTATPNANYVVYQWLVDSSVVQSGGANYTLANVQTNHTLQVTFAFAAVQETIVATAGTNGAINPDGSFNVAYGSNQVFTATPNTNYAVHQWLVDSNVVQAGGTNYTLADIQTNHSVEVTFLEQFIISASTDGNGAINPSNVVGVLAGSNQVFTATANANYAVNQWLLDGSVAQTGGTNYTLANVQTNHTLEVTFSALAPAQIASLTAASAVGSVTLTWPAFTDQSIQYHIYRAQSTNSLVSGGGLQPLATVYLTSSGGAQVQDGTVGTVFYGVLASGGGLQPLATAYTTSSDGALLQYGEADTMFYGTAASDTLIAGTNYQLRQLYLPKDATFAATLSGTNIQFTDPAGQPGLGYYYAVAGVNSNLSEGSYSTPAAGTNLVVWPQAPATDLGGPLELCVTAKSTTALTYEWLFDGQKLSDGGLVSGSQTPCLTMGGVMSTGQFLVVISSSLGSVTSPPIPLSLSVPTIEFAKGTYNGLFYPYPPEEATTANCGAFTLTMAKAGAFSGKVRLADSTESFTGQFSGTSGYATAKTAGKQGSVLPLYLQLDTTPGEERITGVITNNGVACGLYAYLAPKTAAAAANYTLAIPPGGTSPATLPGGWSAFGASLSSGGTLSLSGTLADGTKVSQSATLSPNGDFPLFVPLYKGGGLLMGWLTFTKETAQGDTILWIKPTGQANYPSGFTVATDMLGSPYTAPVTLNDGVLSLQGGGVSLVLTNGVSVVNGKLTDAVDAVAIKFSASSGTFSGAFYPAAHDKVAVSGVFLQQQGEAVGWYLLENESGSLTVEPAVP